MTSHNPLCYGPGVPNLQTAPPTIVSQRNPASSDVDFPIGQQWVNESNNTVWVLSSKAAGVAVWTATGSGAVGGIVTITGDVNGAEVPLAGNFNVLGTANQVRVTGSAHTETISLIGPYTPSTYTAHGVLVGEGASSIVATTAGTNGEVLIAATGADPAFAALTSTGGSITFTPGANTLNLDVSSDFLKTITVQLTSAEVKNLMGTPQIIIPAPAAGKIINIINGVAKLVYGGTNAFTNPQQLDLEYNGVVGILASTTGAGFIDQTADMYNGFINQEIVTPDTIEAKAVVLANNAGSDITGNAANDNSLIITITYQILTI